MLRHQRLIWCMEDCRMTDFKNADLLSVLPESLSRPETQALSAAIRVGLLRLQDYSRAISMYAALRDLPDEVLNLLAVELRTQYYDPAAKRKKREDMVRQTIAWYFRGGTGAVLTEYLATLYQGGRLKEWYDYGGAPYFFKAVVELALDDEIRPGDGERIAERINTYKNVRSWLEDLAFHIGADFSVPISYRNHVRFITGFYPRYNLGYLKLDGKWKLDGTRKLNGYDSNTLLDFYPVRMRVQASGKADIRAGASEIRMASKAQAQAETREALSVRAEASEDAKVQERIGIQTAVKWQAGTESSMTKHRYLNGVWELSGSRKLDGGQYIL